MVEIISGRAGTGKTASCLERIARSLREEPLGKPIILLLPEHMTYRAERELAAMLAQEGRGFSRCCIYGFRRFAYRVLQETGGALEIGLTELGRHLLIKQLLERRLQGSGRAAAGKDREQAGSGKGGLTAFARAARQRGFVAELSDIINELKSYSIDPELLARLAEEINEQDSRLQGKLRDMAVLYEDFNAAMAGRYSDGKDVMARLAERLPQSSLVQGAELWLDGFLFFNPLERQILDRLFDLCSSIHINLTLDTALLQEGRPASDITREDKFYRSSRTRDYILELAQAHGRQVRELFLTQGHRYKNNALRAMEACWLDYQARPLPDKAGIRFVESAAPRMEAEAMAADMVRLVRDKGYRWQDIGILLRDEDAYSSLMEMVLQEYRIPFFNAAHRQGTHHPLAELLRSALAVAVSRQGWSYENVFRCLKTGFFKEACGLLPDDIDHLENYVLEFGIRGRRRWTAQEPWQFYGRWEAEGKNLKETSQERAKRADAARRLVAVPLSRLEDALKNAVAGYSAQSQNQNQNEAGAAHQLAEAMATAVYDFLIELQVPQQLQAMAAQAEQEGRLAQAREHQQIWGVIMELLDQLVELGDFGNTGDTGRDSGEEAADSVSPATINPLQEFATVLEEGLYSLTVSLIPPGLDFVSIASFDQNSLEGLRAIYIPGANAGTMPRHASENVILSDADRLRINQAEAMQGDGMDRSLSVIGQENSYNESWLLYKGFAQASEYLWVSWSLADDAGTGREPAPLVRWLRGLLPEINLWQLLQGEGFVAEPHQALSGLGRAMRHCLDYGALAEEDGDKWPAVYNWLRSRSASRAKDKKQEAAELDRGLRLISKALGSRLGGDRLPAELAEKLFAPKGWLRGSVTRLEHYNTCPFQYYAQYGLGLQERPVCKFAAPDLGNLLHELLREFGEALKKQNRRWSEVEEPEQRAMCHEILYRLAPRLQNNVISQRKQLEAQLRRIENTAAFALRRLCAFDEVSQLHPEFFEQGFGNLATDENQQALELVYSLTAHSRLSLNGRIDRIDTTEDGRYFMIMDYKTGSAAINLMDVYYGLRLQLLTYLLVAREMLSRRQGEPALPVGLLYCFLKKPIASLDSHKESQQEVIAKLESKLKMPGWVISSPEILQLIDKNLGNPGGKSRFINVAMTAGGGINQNYKANVRSERDLEILLAYVEVLLQDTGRRIVSGEIAPTPYKEGKKTGCDYCRYRAICGFDAQLEGFGYRELGKEPDEEFIKLMEAKLDGMDS